jgi:hypothetical protein
MPVNSLLFYVRSFTDATTDTASSEDPTELSFRKGEVLDILTKSDLWWEARKADGTRGSTLIPFCLTINEAEPKLVAPSNYLELLTKLASDNSTVELSVRSSNTFKVYPYKAEAQHTCARSTTLLSSHRLTLLSAADTGSQDDENELSFRKGEILDILTIGDLWWEARNSEGKTGSQCSLCV